MSDRPSAMSKQHHGRLARWWRHWRWALAASMERLLAHPFGTAMTMLVMGLAMSLPLALWLVLGNAQQILGSLGSDQVISVFMEPQSQATSAETLADQLRQRDEVATVTLKSPDEGMAELTQLHGFGEAAANLPYNPLPWVLLVKPSGPANVAHTLALADSLRDLPHVDQVQAGARWRQRLQALVNLGQQAFLLLAVLLVVAMLMVVGQTIRQDLESRAAEIDVLRMAGAGPRFVRRPYLHAGALYGLGAGVVAVLLVVLMEWLLATPVQALLASYGGHLSLRGMDTAILVLLPLLTAMLGWCGARIVTATQQQAGDR